MKEGMVCIVKESGKRLTIVAEVYNPYHGYLFRMDDGNYYDASELTEG